MNKNAHRVLIAVFCGAALLLLVLRAPAAWTRVSPSPSSKAAGAGCPGDDSGLKLPNGFCATVFADGIGHARKMAFGPNGVLYVNTWSGLY